MSRNTKRKKHGVPAGVTDGEIINGRAYTLHPTKGWRSRKMDDFKKDESKLHPLARYFRMAARAKGIIA